MSVYKTAFTFDPEPHVSAAKAAVNMTRDRRALETPSSAEQAWVLSEDNAPSQENNRKESDKPSADRGQAGGNDPLKRLGDRLSGRMGGARGGGGNGSDPQGKPGGKEPRSPRFPVWIYAIPILILLAFQLFFLPEYPGNRIKYSDFLTYVREGYVREVVIVNGSRVDGRYSEKAIQDGVIEIKPQSENAWQLTQPEAQDRFTTVMLEGDDIRPLLDENEVAYEVRIEEDWFGGLMVWLFPLILLVAFWVFIFRRMNPGQQVLSIGKNRATLYDKQAETKVSFKDVAGLEEAKAEVEEVVEFLKNPQKFTTLGGSLPKGVLLVGPPGTGKTLMAKATAGEADVPFFSLSGSDFVEMFVGVGAARVRDLFKQAKEKAPCIVFIDEIDSIGRSRGRGMMLGSNDERENTLNQLLSEMDGFNSDKGVIIMAATNRPDILDSALLRPGRFDRQILIDKPDLNGRMKVLQVHTRKLKLAESIDLRVLASQTPGFAGAELANLCNEAALVAARRNKKAVEMIDFQDAIERVIAGLEKKNKLISPQERRIVAYHESGHAIVGWFLEHTDPVLKVSIVPRGLAALGYTLQTPLEDRFLMTVEELNDRICALLGGRVAEEIVFGRISTGAQNDLERITNLAYAMVAEYGMSEELGYISLTDSKNPENSYGINKRYSDYTARKIDESVRSIIRANHERTLQLLTEHRDKLESLAQTLLTKEVLNHEDLKNLLGDRPHGDPMEHILDTAETDPQAGSDAHAIPAAEDVQVEGPGEDSKDPGEDASEPAAGLASDESEQEPSAASASRTSDESPEEPPKEQIAS